MAKFDRLSNGRIFSVAAALVAGAGVMLVATAAHATASYGCPTGDVCGYASQASYDAGSPLLKLASPATIDGTYVGLADPAAGSVWENNTASAGGAARPARTAADNSGDYSSEGSFLLELGGVCIYVPNQADEQNPGATEIGTTAVQAVALGTTSASVDSPLVVGLGNCH
jgi:hypothetical protein